MGQIVTKKKGFGDLCEGWVPFLLEIKQKAGWLVDTLLYNYLRLRVTVRPRTGIPHSQ